MSSAKPVSNSIATYLQPNSTASSLPGFNYDLNALNPAGTPSELNRVLGEILHAPQSHLQKAMRLLQAVVPIFRPLVSTITILYLVPFSSSSVQPTPGNRLFTEAQATMSRIGEELLADSRASVKSGFGAGDGTRQRDLLSLLLKANATADVPLSDKDLIARTCF